MSVKPTNNRTLLQLLTLILFLYKSTIWMWFCQWLVYFIHLLLVVITAFWYKLSQEMSKTTHILGIKQKSLKNKCKSLLSHFYFMVLSSGSMIVAGPQLASQLALAAAFNQKCWPTTHITHLHNFLPYLTISSILQYSINNADQYDSYYPPRQSNFEALRVFPPYQSCITWQSYKSWESIMAKMVVCVWPFAKGTAGWQVAANTSSCDICH